MAVSGVRPAFSDDGNQVAFSSSDGTLKIYETSTGRLKQEYTPSSHLAATCTCLAWSTRRERPLEVSPRKKKKRKQTTTEAGDTADVQLRLIALGTTSGSIMLYSVTKGDLQSQMDGGHTDRVNDVCWKPEDDSIVSCSDDRHIVEWSIMTGEIKNKWKGDKGSVRALCASTRGRYLFSAGRSIKLWDMDKLEVLKNFTGHENEVSQLLLVSLHRSRSDDAGDGENVDERLAGCYLLSFARGERSISVWRTDSTEQRSSKGAVASFTLPEPALNMCVMQPTEAGQPLSLGVVTEAGQLLAYEHVLNGFVKKPIKAKASVQVASQAARRDAVPRRLPVLAAQFVSPLAVVADSSDAGSNGQSPASGLLMAYGSLVRPAFERLSSTFDEPEVCLVRADPATEAAAVHEATSVSKVKVPTVPNDVTTFGPDVAGAPRKPTQDDKDSASGARKRKTSIPQEMSISERLHALGMDKQPSAPSSSAQHPPKLDSLATLLSQALQCGDKKMLNSVLQSGDEKLIGATVRRLPVPCIVPLVKELARRMHGHAQSGRTLVRWLKAVLSMHTSYLVTFPDLVQSLGGLYSMMDARVEMLPRFMKLQAKLDLMLSQLSSGDVADDDIDGSIAGSHPLLYHRDSSSDEDGGDVDEMLLSLSESEGEWDEPAGSSSGDPADVDDDY